MIAKEARKRILSLVDSDLYALMAREKKRRRSRRSGCAFVDQRGEMGPAGLCTLGFFVPFARGPEEEATVSRQRATSGSRQQ